MVDAITVSTVIRISGSVVVINGVIGSNITKIDINSVDFASNRIGIFGVWLGDFKWMGSSGVKFGRNCFSGG